MKSFRSYLTKLDRSKQSPDNLGTCQPTAPKKLVRTLFATTLVASSQLLAVLSASANPFPTPSQPSPIVPTRTILNGSFEQPIVRSWNGTSTTGSASDNIAGGNIPESYNNSSSPIIWQTTENGTNSGGQYDYKNAVEVWRGLPGNGGPLLLSPADIAASPNRQYAELNGSDNASLYQDICVLPGETIGWSLLHAVRKNSSANPINKMQVSITDPAAWLTSKTPPAIKLYNSGDLITDYNQGWQPKAGTWPSNTTSPKALRFAFQAIQGSDGNITYGNFLDNVKLNLSPIIDFLPTNGGNVNLATTTEGNPTPANPPYYYLSLRINGITTTASTVKINLTGLNAARQFSLGAVLKGNTVATVAGFTATKIGNEITLTIPAGTYDANVVSNYIHIPIDFSDTVKKPNDNLLFTLTTVAGGGTGGVAALAFGPTNCASASRIQVETLLRDDDYVERVQLPLPLTVAARRSK